MRKNYCKGKTEYSAKLIPGWKGFVIFETAWRNLVTWGTSDRVLRRALDHGAKVVLD